ncbi:hypothetical protein EIP91_003760 [Steccherinum ochraceum]|uniref:F-box domain-containing protein n=1 Tax=Steccherinum ochraceum TaxID=92696 RepID=A0A4V2MW35_9APHY|nr:hypothetical protein EIP91_003760 [Steccherinum ochraceum]
MAVFLPPEIRLNVAQRLSRRRLQALCFASRDWRSTAQILLFRVIRVILPRRTVAGFIAFLRSSPHFRAYVHKLFIYDNASDKPPSISVKELFKALKLLPALRCLKFDSIALTGSSKVAKANLPSLPNFHLACSRSDVETSAFNALLTHLRVAELHLSFLLLRPSASNNSAPLFCSEMFQSLRILNVGQVVTPRQAQSEWRTSEILAACPDSLTSLGVGYDINRYRHGRALHEFLQEKGSHIESLNIDYGRWGEIEPEAEEMRLMMDDVGRDGFGGMPSKWPKMKLSTCCPSLKHITFVLFVAYESLDDMKKSSAIFLWRYALRLLASAPKTLCSITVLFMMDGDVPFEDLDRSTIDTVDWRRWDKVLKGLGELERLTFAPLGLEAYGKGDFEVPSRQERTSAWCEEASEFVLKRLRSLHDRDVEFRFA